MKQLQFIFMLLAGMALVSCSPKVSKMITKSYQPVPENEEITIYFNQHHVTSNAETLGVAAAGDGGFTTNCDSLAIISLLKAEARKIGGNALLITEHIRPSFWGSSCHQMTATILRTTGAASEDSVPEISYSPEITETKVFKPMRKLSKFRLSADMGYGWRTAKIQNGLDNVTLSLLKQANKGMTPSADFTYFFNDLNGLGIFYNSHSGNGSVFGTLENGEIGSLDYTSSITSYGLQYLGRVSPSEKWEFLVGVGAGYTAYLNALDMQKTNLIKSTGFTIGTFYSLGVDYKLSKKWAVGIQTKFFTGSIASFEVTEGGVTRTVQLSKDQFESLNNLQLSGGIRFNF